MKPTSASDLAKLCNGKLIGNPDEMVSGMCLDSRECKPGDMYISIIGEKNDGHKFIQCAFDKGVRVFLISKESAVFDGASFILVDDAVRGFCDMGANYVKQFDVKKIAVTGSVGKTTTKMMTTAVFGAAFKTISSRKNYNSDLGVSLTCFDADETTEAIVFEMGMDDKGQIASYVARVKPELAIITNVGISHLERLGSRDNIASAKLEIVNEFNDDCKLVVNGSSDYLKTDEEIRSRATNKSNYKIVNVGRDVVISDLENKGAEGSSFKINDEEFQLPLIGEHNAIDAALACAAGMEFGISLKDAAAALKDVTATDKRLKVENIADIILIDDSYNASPDSVKAGIAAIVGLKAERRLLVLGNMLELGSELHDA
ncbi:MAG: UDP-N-acetylmuramoyl-tripeptide--D-alanyl-D-alanine ligase [Clostridia bacterium]|nr:UDP-N-acetylmuramoyl-tripeptide--D-alanyl-D-alanine ligase [Clostridia bacterium]